MIFVWEYFDEVVMVVCLVVEDLLGVCVVGVVGMVFD